MRRRTSSLPSPAGLAQRLRQGTQDLHHEAERSGLMRGLLRGQLTIPAYAVLLHNLLQIYTALETGLARQAGAVDIDFTPLYRRRALVEDLRALDAGRPLPIAPATSRLVERLQWLSDNDSPLLMAHAYVRYLGDLHGGQLMRDRVARSLGLADTARGMHFYHFGPPAQVDALISMLRSGLDALPVDDEQADALVAEARLGFQHHVDLFRQLPH